MLKSSNINSYLNKANLIWGELIKNNQTTGAPPGLNLVNLETKKQVLYSRHYAYT